MQKPYRIGNLKTSLFLLTICLISCLHLQAQNIRQAPTVQSPAQILKSFDTFYSYTWYNVKYSDPYKAYTAEGKPLSRLQFLSMVASGGYLPLKLKSADPTAQYRLYKLPANTLPDISSTLKQQGDTQLKFYHMEGKPLPDFNFTDLNGKKYNRSTMRGKIVVLKCWFVHCLVCVQEMPTLNNLVNQYKGNPNVVFLSLAIDNKQKLNAFLKTHEFAYNTVPDKGSYMERQLKIDAYPTHLLIDGQGRIMQILDSADDLIRALHRAVAVK